MADAPFFTVVVATFCRGRHIVPTIESALQQTFADFEILIVSDGDPDGTLQEVLPSDPRVRVIALPGNSGSQATPNNAGVAAARGRYIAYLGHDDIWMPNHLEVLAERFRTPGCDVAVSGCAYLGPPTTDLIWITGLADVPGGTRRRWFRRRSGAGVELDASRDFFPPTSFAHRLSLSNEIGGWRLPETIRAPVDADFLLRAADAGVRFVSTGHVTALKFAAGHRYLSYLEPASAEQRDMLAAIRSGAVDDRVCADYVERARAAGTFMILKHPDFSRHKPGELFRQNRSNKGIDRVEAIPLTDEVHCPQSMEPRALDWYPAEQAEGADPHRWSGPSLRPKLLIPFTGDLAARITLHLSAYDPVGIIDGIRLTLNGVAIDHLTRRDHPGQVDLELTGPLRSREPTVLELILPRAFCPAEVLGSPDRRRLGVNLTGFTIAPLRPGVRTV